MHARAACQMPRGTCRVPHPRAACHVQRLRSYGKEDDENLAAALSSVMTTLIDSVCNWLSSTTNPEAQPELLTAFWEMSHRCLVFQPVSDCG